LENLDENPKKTELSQQALNSTCAKTHVSDEKSPGTWLAKSEKTQSLLMLKSIFLTSITACPENRERN